MRPQVSAANTKPIRNSDGRTNLLDASGGGDRPVASTVTSPMANARARSLRKSMSSAERKLWRGVRARRLDSARFRRQHPLGPFIVDFVCLEARLIIEVDGGQHTEDDHIASDACRDSWLVAEGHRVMRVSTTDVYTNLIGVLDTIWAALQETGPARGEHHPHQERHRT
jgi:very-short-patch-repair endonuclease